MLALPPLPPPRFLELLLDPLPLLDFLDSQVGNDEGDDEGKSEGAADTEGARETEGMLLGLTDIEGAADTVG